MDPIDDKATDLAEVAYSSQISHKFQSKACQSFQRKPGHCSGTNPISLAKSHLEGPHPIRAINEPNLKRYEWLNKFEDRRVAIHREGMKQLRNTHLK